MTQRIDLTTMTKGNFATSATLQKLFAPEGTGSPGATNRQPSTSPGMETRPNLG